MQVIKKYKHFKIWHPSFIVYFLFHLDFHNSLTVETNLELTESKNNRCDTGLVLGRSKTHDKVQGISCSGLG